ncbi:MAG: phosphoribosylamine--glycine ligase [Gemmatimonadetes bacterium]|nr:phosphoribosylamine--glycine ligase [Gemmatimonadota bacterium]
MNVLVIGGGGREHALSWQLSRAATVFCAPGNPGTISLATNLPISINDYPAILDAIRDHKIDLTVVGPEAPLADGLADRIEDAGFKVFGPSAAAARIEASKAFAKSLMGEAGVPTATSRTFSDADSARAYISQHPEPLVIKASGLAAGKGAVVCPDRDTAAAAATEMFGGRFGSAGAEVLVEEFMEGEELSVFALTDGEHVNLLPSAQDHKRIGEGDTGPNTGGMGAYSPVSIATPNLLERIEAEVLRPTISAMAARGTPYRGVLYAGLMIGSDGSIKVVEFNCRFGDPEAQAVLPLLAQDFADQLWGVAAGENWTAPSLEAGTEAAVTTVVAATGYPDAPEKGAAISLEDEPPHTILFHAGTASESGALTVDGGRVFSATGLGGTVQEAHRRSLDLVGCIRFEGMVYRRDIAWREEDRAGTS